MSDPVTALGGMTADSFADIAEQPPRGMVLLRGDLSSAPVQRAAAEVAGVTVPAPNRFEGEMPALCWMAPDELLLLCDYDEAAAKVAALAEALQGVHHLALDVSDARAVFRVTGLDAREALAKLTPADMSPAAVPPGTFRRTRMAQVPAAIRALDDTAFEILCFRSVAQYMADLLISAAIPGSEVGYWQT
ncbi:sarcosine oxidase subunit gamma family protein [Psychromarinibacter sp. C21-152]|uniref:Sarcosine oxidase subunit gamma family protein n=1 Tax=Psychromarinibacter sediminicola TaxID=3033385 RepID=A0AAE3NUC1_9RHOB|nr:sarcosine oxidase subunit gamma family protein [Psychromarinibacter sediminicola]MDF0602509.1 sarcosine oxidase subunit gamma family protein [Psychromarinibacter sediminicola]